MTNVVTETMTRSFVRRRLFPANLGDLVMPAFIIVYSAVTDLLEPRFLSVENLDNLASQLAPLFVMSVGQAFTVISGGRPRSASSGLMKFGAIPVSVPRACEARKRTGSTGSRISICRSDKTSPNCRT